MMDEVISIDVDDAITKTRRESSKHNKKHIQDSHQHQTRKMKNSSQQGNEDLEERVKNVIAPKDILIPEGISINNLGSLMGISYSKLEIPFLFTHLI
jgi:hypothetical protein